MPPKTQRTSPRFTIALFHHALHATPTPSEKHHAMPAENPLFHALLPPFSLTLVRVGFCGGVSSSRLRGSVFTILPVMSAGVPDALRLRRIADETGRATAARMPRGVLASRCCCRETMRAQSFPSMCTKKGSRMRQMAKNDKMRICLLRRLTAPYADGVVCTDIYTRTPRESDTRALERLTGTSAMIE